VPRWLKNSLLSLAGVACLALIGYWAIGGATGVLRLSLPDFPDFPEPATTLVSGQQGEIYFSSATPFDLDVMLGDMSLALPTTAVGTLMLPEGASPDSTVPAMIVVHGSGGISPGREMEYGALLNDRGIAAFVIDYYLPRGATDDVNYMLRVLSITEFDAVTDSYSALKILQTHPDIDPTRVGIMGFSYGGMAARFAMDQRIADVLTEGGPGFATHVDYYGPCFQNLNSPAATGAPLLTLRGTEDKSNELPACEKREAELRELGVTVESHVFEGAGHAWEALVERHLSASSPYVAGCEMSYDEQGRSMSGDQYIVNVALETPRVERIAVRLSSGNVLADCVKSGYVVGRDDATKVRSDKLLLNFLGRTL
jgi:dienelactone hydrolase